jgi:hypothetical protein
MLLSHLLSRRVPTSSLGTAPRERLWGGALISTHYVMSSAKFVCLLYLSFVPVSAHFVEITFLLNNPFSIMLTGPILAEIYTIWHQSRSTLKIR